jgi:hypothetical protein
LLPGEEEVFRKLLFVLIAGAAVAACDDSSTDPVEGAEFTISVEGEQFRVRIEDAAEIAQARALIGTTNTINLNGKILRGNGGFNSGYSWHLKPSTVELVDMTIELCDGRPSYVEQNVDYYVDTVKAYCPWGARVLGEATEPR